MGTFPLRVLQEISVMSTEIHLNSCSFFFFFVAHLSRTYPPEISSCGFQILLYSGQIRNSKVNFGVAMTKPSPLALSDLGKLFVLVTVRAKHDLYLYIYV